MSARIVVKTDTIRNALWIPAQALFESDGRKQVYLRSEGSFTAREVELVRRSESRVVIKGLKEGDEVALTNPTEQSQGKQSKSGPSSALKAIPK